MRKAIRKIFRRFGYDIIKFGNHYSAGKLDQNSVVAEWNWIKKYSFNTVIDIGANEGQFSDRIRMLFPDSMIYAFEPINRSFELLQKNFGKDSKFKSFNLALGDAPGKTIFNVNDYSPSSSVLPQTENLSKNFSYASTTREVSVDISTLDNVFSNIEFDLPLLVKIDVQGFENKVIAGGKKVISKAALVLCEVSFVELYKNQPLFDEVYEMLNDIGFSYAGSSEQLRSSESNQVLQADAIFINKAFFNK